jgi:hypothetical protein
LNEADGYARSVDVDASGIRFSELVTQTTIAEERETIPSWSASAEASARDHSDSRFGNSIGRRGNNPQKCRLRLRLLSIRVEMQPIQVIGNHKSSSCRALQRMQKLDLLSSNSLQMQIRQFAALGRLIQL